MNRLIRQQVDTLKVSIKVVLDKLPLKDAVVACEEIERDIVLYKVITETEIKIRD